MSIKIYSDVEQGTDEWHELRRGVLTSSVISALLTPKGDIANNQTSRTATTELVAERITGRPKDSFFSHDLTRGILDEPYARNIYADHTGREVVEVGFITQRFNGNLVGFSPDGLVGDDGLIEIKSRKPRLQIEYALHGTIPHAHMIQMQTGMLVSGRKWCDYVSYSGGLPMSIKRVYADTTHQAQILAAVETFEKNAKHITEQYEKNTTGMPPTEYVDHFDDEIEMGM